MTGDRVMIQTRTEVMAQLLEQARRARALRERINSERLTLTVKTESATELLALVESISITAERMPRSRRRVGRVGNFQYRPKATGKTYRDGGARGGMERLAA
jgi:phosphoenolpyruvate carboxylase